MRGESRRRSHPPRSQRRFSLAGDFGDTFFEPSRVGCGWFGIGDAQRAIFTRYLHRPRFSGPGHGDASDLGGCRGFSDLRVVVSYAGHRSVASWIASVRTGSSCRALPGIPPDDGPLIAESSPSGSPRRERHSRGRRPHRHRPRRSLCGRLHGIRRSRSGLHAEYRRRHGPGPPAEISDVSLNVDLGIDHSADVDAVWKSVAGELALSFVDHATATRRRCSTPWWTRSGDSLETREAFKTARAVHGWDATLVHSLHDGFGVDGLHGSGLDLDTDRARGLSTPAVKRDIVLPNGRRLRVVSSLRGSGVFDRPTSGSRPRTPRVPSPSPGRPRRMTRCSSAELPSGPYHASLPASRRVPRATA